MRICVVGGGSAGHVLPALPVIQRCLDAGHQVTFIGTYSGLEAKLVAHLDVEFKAILAGKLRRYWDWQNVVDLGRIAAAVLQAAGLLIAQRPRVVFSKGGFVSFPVVLVAWLLRIPVLAHESDITPGLANRLAAPFIRTLCVSFDQTHVNARAAVVYTGTPIRDEMRTGSASRGRQWLGVPADVPLLLVTGGSQGAEALNGVVRDALDELTRHYHVVHVCGQGKRAEISHPRYQQLEYVSEGWGDVVAAADIVISRAGANALFELLALGKSTLLVPLSRQASRGDQIDNARYARDLGLVHVLDEADMTPESLMQAVEALADDAQLRQRLAEYVVPDAVAAITRELLALA